jgi:hypothetical protein
MKENFFQQTPSPDLVVPALKFHHGRGHNNLLSHIAGFHGAHILHFRGGVPLQARLANMVVGDIFSFVLALGIAPFQPLVINELLVLGKLFLVVLPGLLVFGDVHTGNRKMGKHLVH